MTSATLDGCTVVMAHPDDEILWASSVLRRAARIVLCFGPLAGVPELGPARERVMRALPVGPVDFLALPEAGSFGRADWAHPQPTPEGLALRADPAGPFPNALADYAATFRRLSDDLTARLAGARDVVTHNPWGEYGHEDHVLVLRAVCAAQAVHGFRIWVTGYVAQKSLPLMLAQRHRIGAATPPLPVDHDLAARARDLFLAEGCWTWFADYVWPETERFFRLLPADTPPAPMTALPLTVICAGAGEGSGSAISRRLQALGR